MSSQQSAHLFLIPQSPYSIYTSSSPPALMPLQVFKFSSSRTFPDSQWVETADRVSSFSLHTSPHSSSDPGHRVCVCADRGVLARSGSLSARNVKAADFSCGRLLLISHIHRLKLKLSPQTENSLSDTPAHHSSSSGLQQLCRTSQYHRVTSETRQVTS
ncbi:hypothetical protein ABVT39_006008 [Epinephelus coioides]